MMERWDVLLCLRRSIQIHMDRLRLRGPLVPPGSNLLLHMSMPSDQPCPPPSGTAMQSLQKAATAASRGVATPRRREKDKVNEVDIIKHLWEFCMWGNAITP